MDIIVSPEIWTRFPGMRILCVTGHLTNHEPKPEVIEALNTAQDKITPESLEHPNLQAWREAYLQGGISMGKYPCSIQAMVKRISKGGRVPSINPLVDFYNSISIGNITPLSGMDLDQLDGPQQLRQTKEGEMFKGIGAEQPELVQPGEICYSDDSHIITRHFCWRQAAKGAITSETTRFILISEIIKEQPVELLDSVREQLLSGLEKHFGITAKWEVISQS